MTSVLDVLDGFATGAPDWPTLCDAMVLVLQNRAAMHRADVEDLLLIAERCLDLRSVSTEMCWLAHKFAHEAMIRIGSRHQVDQFDRARLVSADALWTLQERMTR